MYDVCSAGGGQKRMLSTLELECQVVASDHVCAGNQTQVLSKSNRCPSPLSSLSSPDLTLMVYFYFTYLPTDFGGVLSIFLRAGL